MKKKLYVVHAMHTALPSVSSFVGVFEGRDTACRVAREESRNGREAAVIRQSDAVMVAAYHSGRGMPVGDVYVNYPALWPELYGDTANLVYAHEALFGWQDVDGKIHLRGGLTATRSAVTA